MNCSRGCMLCLGVLGHVQRLGEAVEETGAMGFANAITANHGFNGLQKSMHSGLYL
jgi:hypothetical protein